MFRQVTRDHRPLDVLESRRLQDFIQLQGPADPCHVAVRQRRTTSGSSSTTTTAARSNSHTARIYPGGLAVSRSIGDLNYCKAVIPTPDVVQWKLKDHDAPRTKDVATTHRFLVATDGLWDVLSNETVGRLAARLDDGHEIAPKVAATRVMEHCLERGGSLDDVTILYVRRHGAMLWLHRRLCLSDLVLFVIFSFAGSWILHFQVRRSDKGLLVLLQQ